MLLLFCAQYPPEFQVQYNATAKKQYDQCLGKSHCPLSCFWGHYAVSYSSAIFDSVDHGIWSQHFMANRWGNNGNSERLYFGGSKIIADGHCSNEIKRRLLLGRKVMTNLDRILKSRDITLPTKVHLVKAMVFPVVMYEFESWSINKAEC